MFFSVLSDLMVSQDDLYSLNLYVASSVILSSQSILMVASFLDYPFWITWIPASIGMIFLARSQFLSRSDSELSGIFSPELRPQTNLSPPDSPALSLDHEELAAAHNVETNQNHS